MHDWNETTKTHGEAIWRIIYRIVRNDADAMDCYQDVFSEAYRKSQTTSLTNLPGFLRWLAVRRSIDLKRKKLAQPAVRPISDGSLLSGSRLVEEASEASEMADRIRQELEVVPPNQAEAFWLCCIEQLTYEEAASAMGVSVSNIGVLVHRARSHLKTALADWDVRQNSNR